MAVSLSVFDRILDHATQAAIQCVDQHYPRKIQDDVLLQMGEDYFRRARQIELADVSDEYMVFYTGTFVAAYHRRSRTLHSAPASRYHDGQL